MRLQSFHCPSCAGSLDIKPGAGRVKCAYCGNTLVVEGNAVSSSPKERQREREEADKPEYPEPGATLYTREAPRFEMTVIEQRIPEGARDRFTHVELGDDRFALVYLRHVDDKGKPVEHDLDRPFEVLRASLEQDGDPGLAANCALEDLCRKGYAHRLEVAIMVFEPTHMTMTPFNAGCRDAIWWVSNEEGRCVTTGNAHEPLERKFLREARDHFENGRPVHLAAGDLFVVVSAGFAGRGGSGMWPTGLGTLTETLNEHLGEEPLRVVTLVKNAFWEKRSRHRDGGEHPCGDVKIAAVRAILPPEADRIPGEGKIEVLKTRKYEIAFVKGPKDFVRLVKLHSDRQVMIWMSVAEGAPDEATFEKGVKAILDVLDGQTGDNDNPRCAGRDAYEAMGLTPATLRMAVIQCLDCYGRVKYFRAGWRQAIALGPRGVKSDGMQQFDEGGEATVSPGARLFFPGPLQYEGETHMAEYLGNVWHGGKASRLYEAMREHWKTKRTDKALELLAKAAVSDSTWIAVVLTAVIVGAVWGATFAAIAHAMTGGRRDFSSRSYLAADTYAVTVDAEHVEAARNLLGRLAMTL